MYLTLDIGGTSIKCAMITKKGEIIEKSNLQIKENYEKFKEEICKHINQKKEKYQIEGICISAPGAVNIKTGYIGGLSAIPYIHGKNNIAKDLKEKYQINVAIENDANCAALGELMFGENNNSNMAFVICGTGVGGAIISEKKIHHGKNLYGGEFGFMLVDVKNENEYVWLSEVGAIGGVISNIEKMTKIKYTGEQIFSKYEQKINPFFQEVDNMYKYLAIAMHNIQHIYDPEVIVLGGAISERPDFILNINQKLELLHNAKSLGNLRPNLKTCTFYNDTNLLGALGNFLQNNIIE